MLEEQERERGGRGGQRSGGEGRGEEIICSQAHTCFNVLVIPEYKSEKELKGKLLTSITHCDDGILLS